MNLKITSGLILTAIITLICIQIIPVEVQAKDEQCSSKGWWGDNTVPFEIFADYETWPPDNIGEEELDILGNVVCVLRTTKGVIRIQLFPDSAPLHSANFAKLIQDGFYDGLTFHRVILDFVSQGGDPLGDGTGGPGYTIPAEIDQQHEAGSIAAARTGDQVNPERRSSGSQFYLCHTREDTQRLDGMYTVFGIIIQGQDVNLSLNINYTAEGPIPGAEPDRIIRAWIEWAD